MLGIFDAASPFTFSIALSPRYISHLLVTCFEGGSNDWVTAAVSKNWTRPEGHTTPWYDDPAYVGSDDFAFEITYDDPNDEEGNGKGSKTITKADVLSAPEYTLGGTSRKGGFLVDAGIRLDAPAIKKIRDKD